MSLQQPLHLDKAFSKGYVKIIEGADTEELRPPKGHVWIILNARIYHVTGTITYVFYHYYPSNSYLELCYVPAATATGNYPIFSGNLPTDCISSLWTPTVITDNMYVAANGDGDIVFTIEVLEWMP